MLRNVLLIGILGALLSACAPPEKFIVEKISAPLRLQLDNLSPQQKDEKFDILIKATVPIVDTIKLKLTTLHIEVESVIGDICTARATGKAIRAITNLPYIESIDVARKRNLNGY
jgi:hypothetical protein